MNLPRSNIRPKTAIDFDFWAPKSNTNSHETDLANDPYLTWTPDVEREPKTSTGRSIWGGPVSKGLGISGMVLFTMLFCFFTQKRPRHQHFNGLLIREQARREYEREQRQQQKEKQTPECRQSMINASMYSKRIISRNETNGHWNLGNVDTDDMESNENGEVTLEDSNSSDLEAAESMPDNNDIENGIDDDECCCCICIEPFQVGDVVSWSKHSAECHHVFHAECIQPWLIEKKSDECPNCRSIILAQLEPLDDDELTSEEEIDVEAPKGEDAPGDSSDPVKDEGESEDRGFFVLVNGLIARIHGTIPPAISANASTSSTSSDNGSSSDDSACGEPLCLGDRIHDTQPPAISANASTSSTSSDNGSSSDDSACDEHLDGDVMHNPWHASSIQKNETPSKKGVY